VGVHGHRFHRAVLGGAKCRLDYKLYFSAPAERYPSASAYYRFKARIRLRDGRSVLSPLFGNAGAGERVYVARHDTASEGCWAEQAQKVLAVDVQACRGRSCVPEPFE
jgi:hypothetical protein